ncbi:MAG TPA: dTMP kinase, partial [Caldithrix sp.]|nr:dTMP kinase [Caldithrix sp.]
MTKNYQRFISFEGIDYSGKSTQVKMLVKRLQRLGVEPVVLREPGGTRISERIRDILLDTAYFEMHEKCEILLYEAARAQLVHQKII